MEVAVEDSPSISEQLTAPAEISKDAIRALVATGAIVVGAGVLGGCADSSDALSVGDIDLEVAEETICDTSVGLPNGQAETARERMTALAMSLSESPVSEVRTGDAEACLSPEGEFGTAMVRLPVTVGERTATVYVPLNLIDTEASTEDFVSSARSGIAKVADKLRVDPELAGTSVMLSQDESGFNPYAFVIGAAVGHIIGRGIVAFSRRNDRY